MPEKELPLTVALTGCVYQPLESAARDRPTETVGLDPSYRNATLVTLVVWPALSVQVPVTVPWTVSGPP
jgi:hypothetical protein